VQSHHDTWVRENFPCDDAATKLICPPRHDHQHGTLPAVPMSRRQSTGKPGLARGSRRADLYRQLSGVILRRSPRRPHAQHERHDDGAYRLRVHARHPVHASQATPASNDRDAQVWHGDAPRLRQSVIACRACDGTWGADGQPLLQGSVRATRKPTNSSRVAVASRLRLAERTSATSSIHEPPRITRRAQSPVRQAEPSAGAPS
jgi:hypothetical protein